MDVFIRIYLRQNILRHLAGNIGQSERSARVLVGQLFVIESQQMQDGGVPVVRMNFAFDRFLTDFIRCAVAEAAFDTSASHP